MVEHKEALLRGFTVLLKVGYSKAMPTVFNGKVSTHMLISIKSYMMHMHANECMWMCGIRVKTSQLV